MILTNDSAQESMDSYNRKGEHMKVKLWVPIGREPHIAGEFESRAKPV
jgi:hypothetical protein